LRSRATLILFLFFILLLILLAQNGGLTDIFAGLTNSTPNFYSITARPFVTSAPARFSTSVPNNQILPTAYLPTSYLPPAYAPTYPGQVNTGQSSTGNTNTNSPSVPVGVKDASGQCIVPNGWIPYTIQSGETLAIIAQAYNLTVEQLAAANCLDNPDLIFEGQIIAVPPSITQ
jgi:hypothetical protein